MCAAARRTQGCSMLVVMISRLAEGWLDRALNTALLASDPLPVKTISSGFAPMKSAMTRREFSTSSRACLPAS